MSKEAVAEEPTTFGEKAARFLNAVHLPSRLPGDPDIVRPHISKEVRGIVNTFYKTFFNDNHRRIFILGINPGRLGSGVTGVPFTDPTALEIDCGIKNWFPKRREITSEFIYEVIKRYGGAEVFYRHFYLSAVSPVGFTLRGKNHNYYDDASLFEAIEPFIVRTLKKQISFGAYSTAILLGSGKNQEVFAKLNGKYVFFKKVIVLEHPRYIMQYQRRHIADYLEKYTSALSIYLKSIETSQKSNP